jgi:hypothetical protein
MAVPLRKDRPEEEELTTADLAQGARPEKPEMEDRVEPAGPKPVASERNVTEMPHTASQAGELQPQDSTPLFPTSELENLRTRWKEIQTAFVDEPRKAVEQADGLVASAMKRLAEVFAEERSKLEKQWDRGDNVSTEDLRVALQRYRTFFHKLLSV